MSSLFAALVFWVHAIGSAGAAGLGSQVYVVERATGSLAIYDYMDHRVVGRVEGLGNLRHALMAFSPDLQYGYIATRGGLLSRIDLERGALVDAVQTSNNSIDMAISQDGATLAVAEYAPGGLSLLDAATMEPLHNIESPTSRVTGIVDAPGNRFVCVAMEDAEIWIVDASKPDFPVQRRIPTEAQPYDAMITADGRFYLVGHLNSDLVSVVDLDNLDRPARSISLADPDSDADRSAPVKLPHMASWASAGGHVFVPLVGQAKLAVFDAETWERVSTVALRGHPVYAVGDPYGRRVWVSFSGEDDDAWLQIIDSRSLQTVDAVRVGRRIYHMDFTPRGGHLLVSANADDQLVLLDTATLEVVDRQTLQSPSGVFGPWRAFQPGL